MINDFQIYLDLFHSMNKKYPKIFDEFFLNPFPALRDGRLLWYLPFSILAIIPLIYNFTIRVCLRLNDSNSFDSNV